jgi:hypothetical protein
MDAPGVSLARITGFSGRALGRARRRGLSWLGGWPARLGIAPAATPRRFRPVIVPASLDDLRGPASGVEELPVRLYWSAGSRQFDLADPDQVTAMCEAVIDAAATIGDITSYLNGDLLVRAWPGLGMNRAKRDAWEARFPALRRQRIGAAA